MNRIRSTLCLLFTLSLSAGAVDLSAQRDLGPPDATFPDGFALVQRVRELPDGRVMLADPLGQALVVLDMSRGTADTLSGVGQGPGEYRQPDAVFAMPGDSTLLVDLGNARLTVLAPDGSFTETMPIAQGEPGPGGGLLIITPAGVDSQGRIYFRPFGGAPGRGLPDSAAIVRWDRRAGTMDTVAQVKLPDVTQSTSGGPNNRSVSVMPIPLSPQDGWAVAWDGRVVVARAPEYRVDWIAPDGRMTRGGAVEYDPVPIRRADKDEWMGALGGGLRIGMTIENGEPRVSLGRGGGSSGQADPDQFDWPAVKPPFDAGGVWVSPEGDAWVRRYVAAGQPIRIDIFGPDGRRKGEVVLGAGRRIVGFGRGVVYAVRSDDLGLQWLERYRRPAGT